jgi:hypothetical protein
VRRRLWPMRLAIDLDRSRRRRDQPGEDAERGRLAGAVRPEQRKDLTGLERERDVLEASRSPKRRER